MQIELLRRRVTRQAPYLVCVYSIALSVAGCDARNDTAAVEVAVDSARSGLAAAAEASSSATPSVLGTERSVPKVAHVGAQANRTDPRLCPKLCQHTLALKCGGKEETCLSACEQMLSVPVCASEVNVVYECMTALDVSAFECGAEGMPSVKDGHCDAEQAAFSSCYQRAVAKARQ